MNRVVYLPSSLKGDAKYFVSPEAYEFYLNQEAELRKHPLEVGFDWKLLLIVLIKELA